MTKKPTTIAIAIAIAAAPLGALNRAREIRRAVEVRDRVYRAAPSDSVDDLLARLQANHGTRAAVRGDK